MKLRPAACWRDADLAGTGLADLDLFPDELVGTAGLVDSDRVGHGGASTTLRARKRKAPPRHEPGGAFL